MTPIASTTVFEELNLSSEDFGEKFDKISDEMWDAYIQTSNKLISDALTIECFGDAWYATTIVSPEHGFYYEHTEIKCECGAETAGTGGHSSWCPKFEETK